ncbi:Kidins220, partial [Symbiodinium sp. KB8]
APRIHNAYMLSYVRVDSEKELLTPPVLNKEGSEYRALIERCTREEKLAEARKRARYEQMMRIEVKAVLERDLMKMKGFWPMSPEDIPISESCKVSRDDQVEDVLSALMEQGVLARSNVNDSH